MADEALREQVRARADEIMTQDPHERSQRTMRILAARIADHEIKLEQERASRARQP
jgi:hypothetical protein